MKDEDVQKPQSKKEIAYPLYGLESCIKFAAVIKDLGGSKGAVKKSLLAQQLGIAESTPSFFQKLSSAKAYGIIGGWGSYSLSDFGRAYFYPTNESDKLEAALQMLAVPPVFGHLIKRFDGERLPSNEMLGNILHQEFAVPDSWKDRVASFFVTASQFLGIIDNAGVLRYDAAMHMQPPAPAISDLIKAPASDALGEALAGIVPPNPSNDSWKYDQIRLETPRKLPKELWDKLNAYVQMLKPTG